MISLPWPSRRPEKQKKLENAKLFGALFFVGWETSTRVAVVRSEGRDAESAIFLKQVQQMSRQFWWGGFIERQADGFCVEVRKKEEEGKKMLGDRKKRDGQDDEM